MKNILRVFFGGAPFKLIVIQTQVLPHQGSKRLSSETVFVSILVNVYTTDSAHFTMDRQTTSGRSLRGLRRRT
jgi:hypothetical protein